MCRVEDCSAPAKYVKEKLCNKHYLRLRHRGTTETSVIIGDDVKRFWSKVIKAKGCWGWKGCQNGAGYSQFQVGHKTMSAHKYSYQMLKGRVPEGLHLDHLCRNRACVNPEHLEAVTPRANITRGELVFKKKDHLPVGVKKVGNRFMARKYVNGGRLYLGCFATVKRASQAYLDAGDNNAIANY